MLTPFGKEIRKLRLDREMRLLDLAKSLQKTSSFVSALETGKKPIPEGYVDQVVVCMKLTKKEAEALRRAADRTKKEVSVDELAGDERELVAAFARRLDEIPHDLLERLRKKVLKSLGDSSPFARKRGHTVPPQSTAKLWDNAELIRQVFSEYEEIAFPIMDVLEFRLQKMFPDFYLDFGTLEEMGLEEGRVIPGGDSITLRDDVYENAWKGQGRARFTACHELAHFLLHRNVPLSRMRSDGSDPIYCDSEWQADTFAGALMMSRHHLDQFVDEADAAEQCQMTYSAAEVQWSKYEGKGMIKEPGLDLGPGFL